MQFKVKVIFRRWLLDENDNIVETYFPDVASVNQAAIWIKDNHGTDVLEGRIEPEINQCINIDLFTTTYNDAVSMIQAFKTQFGDGIETYWVIMRQ